MEKISPIPLPILDNIITRKIPSTRSKSLAYILRKNIEYNKNRKLQPILNNIIEIDANILKIEKELSILYSQISNIENKIKWLRSLS